MRRSGISKCSDNSCCLFAFNDWRVNIYWDCSRWHIGISATAKSLCPSCKSQRQQANEGGDYTVLLHCIPNHIDAHTLFSTDCLLLCGIGDELHELEWLRCIPFGILLHFSRSTCISHISFPSSHYCLHLPPFRSISTLLFILSCQCCWSTSPRAIPVSSEAFNVYAYHSPIRSAFEVTVGNIVLIVELHFLNASENSVMPSLTSTSTANYNTWYGVS